MTGASRPATAANLARGLRGAAPPSWCERFLSARDRLFGNPAFRRWAAATPLLRGIARRRARAVFDLTAGFVYSQVLQACVRLRLFDLLAEGPQSVAALAPRLGLSEEATRRLLAGAAALELVTPRAGGRWGLGTLGTALVDNPAVAALVEHHGLLYRDLEDPVALLRDQPRSTSLASFWPYAEGTPAPTLEGMQVTAYTSLMAASQPLVGEQVLDAYPLRRHRCLLDVGGGDGTFLAAAARRAPHLRLMLFDLPPVAARARERLAINGLGGAATAFGGDFLVDALPAGADLITLLRVIHDHDDEEALTILRAARRALPRNGVLLVAEPMAGTPGAEPMGDAYFGFYLLAMGRGRPRTAASLGALLRDAGFERSQHVPTAMPLQCGLIVAQAS